MGSNKKLENFDQIYAVTARNIKIFFPEGASEKI
jgi:hypothetical protein